MSLFVVDTEKCSGDGICAAACPLGLIRVTGSDSSPSPVTEAERLCINCGHCVAVCPHGALALTTMGPEECIPYQAELFPSPEQVRFFLTARRSIRRYKNMPVGRNKLSELIDIARYAPTGHNSQQVNWLIVEDSNEVNQLAGLVIDWMSMMITQHPAVAQSLHLERVVAAWGQGKDTIFRGAPHVIVAHAPGEHVLSQSSCTIALTYLELAASAMGLGACWAGFFHAASTLYPPLISALALPEGHKCFGAMMVGYPQYKYHRIPLRKESVITWR